MLADNFHDEKQSILLCPRYVECTDTNIRSCHISDDQYNIWVKPNYQGQKLLKGVYKFKEAIANGDMPGWPICKYYLNDNQPFPITVGMEYDPERKYNLITSFQPLISEKSRWKFIENNPINCIAEDVHHCSFIEAPEITTINGVQMRFYFPNPNNEWEPNYIVSSRLSYEELYKICGVTSNCMVQIGECGVIGDFCNLFGEVDLDISNPQHVKINQLITNPLSPRSCTLKKREPFNTIVCEPY